MLPDIPANTTIANFMPSFDVRQKLIEDFLQKKWISQADRDEWFYSDCKYFPRFVFTSGRLTMT